MADEYTGFDFALEDEPDERIIREYRGTPEYNTDDGEHLIGNGQIDEVNLRLAGYRREDLERVFGPRTERTQSGRAVWSLKHVRQVEAERFGPLYPVIRRAMAACLDIETLRRQADHVFGVREVAPSPSDDDWAELELHRQLSQLERTDDVP
ncbi:hypothetical protein [Nocardia asteroides]|uniref:hypothetical protein n=1 Tax=Nocardia asteroides TaxID=1824 RepID=UPI001E5E001D|nr:hypothetical protein [Nocardia asteroides]UGT62858.1 hypothetical protein LTT61_05840 [Nocardia asteroides]